MTCSPAYDKATATSDLKSATTGPVLVLTPCTCGDENHGFTAAVYPDRFFNQEGDQPHLEGS